VPIAIVPIAFAPITFAPIAFVANETFGRLQMSCLAKLVLGGTKCDRLKYKVVLQVLILVQVQWEVQALVLMQMQALVQVQL